MTPLFLVFKVAQVIILLASLGCLGYGTWRLVDEIVFRIASTPMQGEVVAFRESVESRASPNANEHWRKDERVSVRYPVVRFRSPVDDRLHRLVSNVEAPGGEEVGAAVAVRASTRGPAEARVPHLFWSFLLPAFLLLAGLLATLLVIGTWHLPDGFLRETAEGARLLGAMQPEESLREAAEEASLFRALWPAVILVVIAVLPTALRLADPYLSPVVPGLLLLDAGQLARAMRAAPPPAGSALLSQAEIRIARLPFLGRRAATRAVLDAIGGRRHEDLRRYLAAQRDPALRFPAEIDRTALFSAALDAGDAAAVQILLDAGRDPRGDPLVLSRAVGAGRVELVRLLAAHGAAPADPAAARELVDTALVRDDDATLLALVQLGWADRSYPSSERSLLDRALVHGLARTSAELERRGAAGTSPLLARLAQGDLAGMRAVSPEPEWRDTRIDEAPLLTFAAMAGQLPVVRRLVELGADPAAVASIDGKAERTALDLAAERGHLDVVRYLARLPGARAYVEPGDRESPVSLAAAAGRWDVVEALVEAGASPNGHEQGGPYWNETPLHSAAREANATAVAYLLGHGADPRAEGQEKLLPVELAEDPAIRTALEQAGGRGP